MDQITDMYDEPPYVSERYQDRFQVDQKLVCYYNAANIYPATIKERKWKKIVLIDAPIQFMATVEGLKAASFVDDAVYAEFVHKRLRMEQM